MANLTTVSDLRHYALFRAGESPTDIAGDFWNQALIYINDAQRMLIMGSSRGTRDVALSSGLYSRVVDIPMTDWWWSRKRGVFNFTSSVSGTASIALGGTAVSFGQAQATAVSGWRIKFDGRTTIPFVSTHNATDTSATLDFGWPENNVVSGTAYTAFQADYILAPDFVRFISRPSIQAQRGISSRDYPFLDVVSLENLEWNYPVIDVQQDVPAMAALIDASTIRVNCQFASPTRVEYEYVAMPATLASADTPILPLHYRPALALAAAMWILQDKNDERHKELASEFREHVKQMMEEHRRMAGGGSGKFGAFRPMRAYGYNRRVLRTSSGFIIGR